MTRLSGRDLDKAVATALGHIVSPTHPWMISDTDSRWEKIPLYSRSFAACDAILDWADAQGRTTVVSGRGNDWDAQLVRSGWTGDLRELSVDNPALALCQAFLLAVDEG